MNVKHLVSLALLLSAPLLSAAGFAPDSLDRAFARIYIQSGTGAYADSGETVMWLEGGQFRSYGSADVQGASGTYTYARTGTNTGRLSRFVVEEFIAQATDLNFSAPNSGSYSIADAFGTQTATFEITLPADPTAPGDWLYDKYYPWVWTPSIGWMYHRPTIHGVEVWHANTDTWHRR